MRVLLRPIVSLAVVMPVGAVVLGIICLASPLDFLTATAVAILTPKFPEMALLLEIFCVRTADSSPLI